MYILTLSVSLDECYNKEGSGELSEKKAMKMSDTSSRQVSRWLPLLWILAVGLWALGWGNFATNWKSEFLALFAVHIALHLSLAWSTLLLGKQRVLQILYFVVQGMLVLSLSLLGPPALGSLTISSGLYLVLIGEATIIVRRRGPIVLLVGSYLLLYLLGFSLKTHIAWNPGPYIFLIPFFISLLPFAVGYLQTQARVRDRTMLQALEATHAQLAATHAELETAHVRLATSAAQVEELTRLTERQRLARDLHDTLAQGLSGLILQLEVTHSRLAQGRNAQAQSLVHDALLDAQPGAWRGAMCHRQSARRIPPERRFPGERGARHSPFYDSDRHCLHHGTDLPC